MKGQWERNDSSKKSKRLTVYIRYFNWQRKNFITLNHEDYDRSKTMQLFFFFRTMSWNDYLLELAIYIIAARSNLSPVPVEGSEWTKSVVVSTEMDCDMERTSLWYQLIINHEDLFFFITNAWYHSACWQRNKNSISGCNLFSVFCYLCNAFDVHIYASWFWTEHLICILLIYRQMDNGLRPFFSIYLYWGYVPFSAYILTVLCPFFSICLYWGYVPFSIYICTGVMSLLQYLFLLRLCPFFSMYLYWGYVPFSVYVCTDVMSFINASLIIVYSAIALTWFIITK